MYERVETSPVVRSGVAPIEERLGGLAPGKVHLITGATGAGKTAVCLAFLATGLAADESTAILTQDDPRDLLAQAADLGLDLRQPVADGRLVVLRYQREFGVRIGRALSAEPALDEFAHLMDSRAPNRLAIDSVAPFLDGGSASGVIVAALADFLDRLSATTLITYPGDLRDRYDRRLEPLVQRCAAVVHLSALGEGIGRMDVIKARRRLRSDSAAFFVIQAGRGIVTWDGGAPGGAPAKAQVRRQILLLRGGEVLPQEFLTTLESAYVVSLHGSAATLVLEALPAEGGAIIVAARWDMLGEMAMLLQQLRHAGNRTPVVLVTRGDIRSSDRAYALVAGFDEVIPDSVGPDEFMARVTAVVRRGRSTTVPLLAPARARRPASPFESSRTALDEPEFRAAVTASVATDAARVFSLLLFRAEEGEREPLADLIARTTRGVHGDIVGVVDGRVAVYLPGTQRADAAAFLRRVAGAWRRSGCGELRVTQLAYPIDAQRLRTDFELPALSVHRPSAP